MSFIERMSDKLWPLEADNTIDLTDEGAEGDGGPASLGLTEDEKRAMEEKFWGVPSS